MFVARLSVAFALVFSQGLFVKEIFNQPNANPTSGGDQSTQVIPTVPVQNIPPLSLETLLPELVPKRVRKFSIFGPVDHDEASEPVLAPVFKATTPFEILYEVSSNGTFANAPKWKLNLITAQIRKYGELFPVDQIRPQLEFLLAETSLDPTKRIIVAWLDYLPKVFTKWVYRDMLRQVARATSRDEVDEILAEKQREFALVAQKFYDAQEKFLAMT